jgi:hypothetical protein
MALGASQALRISEGFAAVSSMILAAEIFSQRNLFAARGLLSWRIERLNHPVVSRFLVHVGLDVFFQTPTFLGFQAVRFIMAMTLLFAIVAEKSTWMLLLLMVLITLTSHFRASAANDGSDQFTLIVLIASCLAEIVGSPLAYRGACYFIAGEAMVAYSTSGWLKLAEPGWRDGSIVTGILGSSTYGNPRLHRLFATHARVSVVSGLAVAAGDCMLGVAAFLPPSAALLVLLFGVALHAGIARVLGLNTFLWAFCATYAPTYFVSSELYRMICGR